MINFVFGVMCRVEVAVFMSSLCVSREFVCNVSFWIDIFVGVFRSSRMSCSLVCGSELDRLCGSRRFVFAEMWSEVCH